ncbi:ORF MSV105 hypothetical protein [Melanoplus sanguinipes entomopoxvirus]|uniref:Transmembrane protein n=1 Tax=Melanoplus sanguinipes entomopoxvirus TaxID=83191 RepID=Q9YVY7_MSEPV|nr:ORF MSV105 hypothetical protein [Melanoplus sanguinipes entomopoxvirus]AAC97651.1 ORF MSV105 hypothetical protein [Melanoplus sanguinipes entomopoxvirus 'O']
MQNYLRDIIFESDIIDKNKKLKYDKDTQVSFINIENKDTINNRDTAYSVESNKFEEKQNTNMPEIYRNISLENTNNDQNNIRYDTTNSRNSNFLRLISKPNDIIYSILYVLYDIIWFIKIIILSIQKCKIESYRNIILMNVIIQSIIIINTLFDLFQKKFKNLKKYNYTPKLRLKLSNVLIMLDFTTVVSVISSEFYIKSISCIDIIDDGVLVLLLLFNWFIYLIIISFKDSHIDEYYDLEYSNQSERSYDISN